MHPFALGSIDPNYNGIMLTWQWAHRLSQLSRQLVKWQLRVYASRPRPGLSEKPLQNTTSLQSHSNNNLLRGSLLFPPSPVIDGLVNEGGGDIILNQNSHSTLVSSTDGGYDVPSSVIAEHVSSDPTPSTPLSTIASDSDNEQRSPNSHACNDLLVTKVIPSGEVLFSPPDYVSVSWDPFGGITTLS